MKIIKKRTLLLLIFPVLLTSCKLKTVFENTNQNGEGVQICRIGVAFLGGRLCPDNVEYEDQINNSYEDRFNVDLYTILVNSSGSLEGKWLVFDTAGRHNERSEDKSKFREVCDVKLQEGKLEDYDLTCIKLSSHEMKYIPASSTVDVIKNIREGEFEGEKYTRTGALYGTITDMNRIDFFRKTTIEYENGDVFEETDNLYSMIRLGGLNHTLGKISINKNDYDGNILLEKEYTVSYLIEGEKTENYAYPVSFFSDDKTLLGTTYNYIVMPKKGIHAESDHAPNTAGAFRGLYEEVASADLRFRQYDYIQNDSSGMEVNFKVNRVQFERFKTYTTIGKIYLTF